MKFSGFVFILVALLSSACHQKQVQAVRGGLRVAEAGLIDPTIAPGGGGTTGGNPALTSENASANPSFLSLCMAGAPVLLQGKVAIPVIAKYASSAQPFDLLTGDGTLALSNYPPGEYTGVRITYLKGCGGDYSAKVRSTYGEFETSSLLTIEFDGPFEVFGKSTILTLNIRDLLGRLGEVRSSMELPAVFASTLGLVRK